MTLSWVATLYTLYQMCALHEVKGRYEHQLKRSWTWHMNSMHDSFV